MKPSKAVTAVAICLIFSLWIYSFLFVPTFDLDESLYRRVAEEMKWNQDYWHPVWDGLPLHHKPPIFYWLIVFFSHLIDGANASVSILAARLPSFFATLGILFSIARTQDHSVQTLIKTVLLWGCTLFPLITSTSVILDPLQTLALLPCLLIPHRAFSEKRTLTKKEYLYLAFSMFAGSAIKGLTGLILPTAALAIHFLISNYKTSIKEGLRFAVFSFIPAVALCLIYYWFLDLKVGPAFTKEFFLVHHLGRGTQAMEAHHGPFYYYFGIILLGGGLLIPLLSIESIRTRFNFKSLGYPLSFALGSLIFFSVSATKLPHYTWPIWPALLLQLMVLQKQPSKNVPASTLNYYRIFLIPLCLLGFVLFWFVMNSEIIKETVVSTNEILSLSMAATLCLMAVLLFKKFMKQIEFISLFMILITITIAIPASSIAERILVTPFFEVARAMKPLNPKPDDCIWDSGRMTATLSLALGKELGQKFTHHRCEPAVMKFLIAPTSKKEECAERKMSVILQGPTLTLCAYL